MKNIILLVTTESNLPYVSAAGGAIARIKPANLWVVVSPALAMDTAEVREKFAKDIADMQVAEQGAAARGDYESAKGYKQRREALELDKRSRIRNAWRSIDPKDMRATLGRRVYAPLFKAANPENKPQTGWRDTVLDEYYDDLRHILAALHTKWNDAFVEGEYTIVTPSELAALAGVVGLDSAQTAVEPAQKVTIEPVPVVTETQPEPEKPLAQRTPPTNKPPSLRSPKLSKTKILGLRLADALKIASDMDIQIPEGTTRPKILLSIAQKMGVDMGDALK